MVKLAPSAMLALDRVELKTTSTFSGTFSKAIDACRGVTTVAALLPKVCVALIVKLSGGFAGLAVSE